MTEETQSSLEWTTHPLKKRPTAATLVTIFVLVVSLLVFYITSSKAFATLALVVLFGSLAKFYLPTKYRLTDEKIYIKSTTQTIVKPWENFRSCYVDKNGILLSPFAEPSRLENFRGVYLIFSDNANNVTAFVKGHINRTQATPIAEKGAIE